MENQRSNKDNLDERFQEAVQKVSNAPVALPTDIKLVFYGYFKRAIGNTYKPDSIEDETPDNYLVGGFKMNALLQTRHLTPEEAKEKYIELAERILKD